jgi:hypothetical protein
MAITYEFVWWERLYELCFRLYQKIVNSEFTPDVIVGVARGGWVPARVLSDLFFNKESASVKVDLYRGIYAREPEPKISQSIPRDMQWKHPLLVDDIADTGDSLIAAMNHLEERGYKNLRTATLHFKPWSSLVPNYYIVKTEAWVVYPWELKEFTYELATQLTQDEKSPREIESQLLSIGVPIHYAQLFLRQWLKTEAKKVPA